MKSARHAALSWTSAPTVSKLTAAPVQVTLATLLTLLCASSPAQGQAQLGRLFNSTEERMVLDALRQRAAATAPAGAAGMTGAGAAAGPMPGMAPAGASTELPPGFPQQVPPPEPPPGAHPDFGRDPAFDPAPAPGPANTAAMPAPRAYAQMADPAGPAATAATAAANPAATAAAEQLKLNGVLRTSTGRSTIWLNNAPQRGAAAQINPRDARKALTVTLPSGRRIVLQPGQRYDLVDGRVKDVNEP